MKKLNVFSIMLVFSFLLLFASGTQPPGSGTEESPYLVSTLDHLLWITTNSSSWSDYFEQTADIDASGTQYWDDSDDNTDGDKYNDSNDGTSGGNNNGWVPIGTSPTKFTGIYDGQSYTIDNLCINRLSQSEYVGLFGFGHGCDLMNIGLTNVDITGYDKVGALMGYQEYSATVTDCYATGDLSGHYDVGGLVGYNYHYAEVHTSYSSVSVTATAYSGGLVGDSYDHCLITRSYSTGTINGSNGIGGLVGWNSGTSTVSNCYSTGSVSGSSNVGGLVGFNNNVIYNSFWDTTSSGQTTSSGGTGKSTSEMKNIDTYTDETTVGLVAAWDFETDPNDDEGSSDFWDMDNSGTINNGYPFLSWQNGGEVALPINLSYFDAVYRNNAVTVTWRTESETNNSHFLVYRNDEVIASIEGAGTTSEPCDYEFTDRQLISGNTHAYMLADVDYSGKETRHLDNTITIAIPENDIPQEFTLEANYPNPFNPKTVINYQLTMNNEISINIYDVSGRKIETLVNEFKTAGTHKILWNASPYPSGIYFYRLEVENFAETRKMVLIK